MTGNEKEFWHTWLSGRVQTLENPIRVFELAIEYQVIWLIDACIKAYPDSIKESLPLLLTVSNEVSSVYLNEEIAQMSKTLQGINHYDHKEVENLKKIAQGITPNNYKDQLNAFLKIALSDKDFQKKPQYKIYRKELIDCMMNNWIIKGVLTAGNGIATIHLTKQSKVNQSWMVPQLIIAAESTIFNAKQKKGTSKVIEIPETPENEIFFKILCESKDLKELTKDQLLKMHALAIKHQVTWLKIECEQLTKNSRLHK
jgi:hypothetical protein